MAGGPGLVGRRARIVATVVSQSVWNVEKGYTSAYGHYLQPHFLRHRLALEAP